MPSIIDLDHNATTPPHPEVIAVVAEVLRSAPGNPGSAHSQGRQARRVLEAARETIAGVLGARPDEVVFTSGGTEAINHALRGLASGRPGEFAAPPGEHSATEKSLEALERLGWRRRVLPLTPGGTIAPEGLADIARGELNFATSLLAHNETGVAPGAEALIAACAARGIPVHVDAVQAIGKLDVNFLRSGAAMMAIAAHKFRGPRGIGALLIREGLELPSMLHGGGQERGRRPGTECPALAAGMAKALELLHADRDLLPGRMQGLRDRLERGLAAACEEIVVHGAGGRRLPNTSSVGFPGCSGEALLAALDLAGVCASLGSTCASGSAQPAPVLLAMGCSRDIARSTLRFSIGWTTTAAEIDEAIARIAPIVQRLRSASRA